MTNAGTEALDLKVGKNVIAFFKASHVLIATEAIINISARNKLSGKIEKVILGAVNAEINIALASGDKVLEIIKSTDVMIAK